jgi:hypothetical protein
MMIVEGRRVEERDIGGHHSQEMMTSSSLSCLLLELCCVCRKFQGISDRITTAHLPLLCPFEQLMTAESSREVRGEQKEGDDRRCPEAVGRTD